MNEFSKTNINNLFNEANEEGLLGEASQQILVENINNAVIAGANGKAAEEIDATDVTLVTLVIDNSGSIQFGGLDEAVREGQNALLDTLSQSKQNDSILLAQWKLGVEAELVHSYLPLDEAVRLDTRNYHPNDGTALYDVWMSALASNVAYAQTLAATGTLVNAIALIITDGRDEHSRQHLARDCAELAKDLLASETFHLAFVGVGSKKTFKTVAEEMGFPKGSVLVADATASEVRRAINLASQSMVRASQGLIQPGANSGFFAP